MRMGRVIFVPFQMAICLIIPFPLDRWFYNGLLLIYLKGKKKEPRKIIHCFID